MSTLELLMRSNVVLFSEAGDVREAGLRAVRWSAAMVNGGDTAETDSDAEAVQEVAQQAMGSGGENFVGGGAPMGEPSVVSNDSGGRHGDDYSLVQVHHDVIRVPLTVAVPQSRFLSASADHQSMG